MGINVHNYEAYLLDYHEGSLSSDRVSELLTFAKAHPDLNIDFSSFENLAVVPDKRIFQDKELLKILPSGVPLKDHLLISAAEGVITPSENAQLRALIKAQPGLQRELFLYENSRLSTDIRVLFPRKYLLKKRSAVVRWLYPIATAAAALVCFILGYWHYQGNTVSTPGAFATITPPAIKRLQIPKSNMAPLIQAAKTPLPVYNKRLPVIVVPMPEKRPEEPLAIIHTHELKALAVADTIPGEPEFVNENFSEKVSPKTLKRIHLPAFAVQYVKDKLKNVVVADFLQPWKKYPGSSLKERPLAAMIGDDKHHSFWEYASLGFNKLAETAGSDIKIEYSGRHRDSKQAQQ